MTHIADDVQTSALGRKHGAPAACGLVTKNSVNQGATDVKNSANVEES
jgi:hypothetical protein